MARILDPTLVIDGPMQADTASIQTSEGISIHGIHSPANVLVLPNLASANIVYKMLEQLADAEMTGPILEGMNTQFNW